MGVDFLNFENLRGYEVIREDVLVARLRTETLQASIDDGLEVRRLAVVARFNLAIELSGQLVRENGGLLNDDRLRQWSHEQLTRDHTLAR